MIILRKTKSSDILYYKLAGNLIGDRNGENQIFATEYGYKSEHIAISYNGQFLHSPEDFTEVGYNEIVFKYLKPTTDDVLRVYYEYNNDSYQSIIIKGKQPVQIGSESTTIVFDMPFSSINYIITTSLINLVDFVPASWTYSFIFI